jgi:precorrin-6A/cobalt-precorrin-6A reductase
MKPEATTLVMAGAREAHPIILGLLARNRPTIASLPASERMFDPPLVSTRIGPFDDQGTFSDWLAHSNVRAIVDASHVFDGHITDMVAKASAHHAVPAIRVLRPEWTPSAKDRWRFVPDIRTAVDDLPDDARVFCNTGWSSLSEFSEFRAARLFLRQTHAPSGPAPYPFAEIIEGAPPFSQFQEQALFERLGVTHLICRNVGGPASMSKLLAARHMGLPVYMVARPVTPPNLPVVQTVAEALDWEARN